MIKEYKLFPRYEPAYDGKRSRALHSVNLVKFSFQTVK